MTLCCTRQIRACFNREMDGRTDTTKYIFPASWSIKTSKNFVQNVQFLNELAWYLKLIYSSERLEMLNSLLYPAHHHYLFKSNKSRGWVLCSLIMHSLDFFDNALEPSAECIIKRTEHETDGLITLQHQSIWPNRLYALPVADDIVYEIQWCYSD